MAKFTDNKDFTWDITFDAMKLRRLRETLKVDLTKEGGKDFDSLSEDFEKLIDVLWHLCEKQARGIKFDTEEFESREHEFASRLVGEAIERAVDCLRSAVNDFLPPSNREVFLANVEENTARRKEARARIIAKNTDPKLRERLFQEMDAAMDREVEVILTRLRNASNGQEPLESAPRD